MFLSMWTAHLLRSGGRFKVRKLLLRNKKSGAFMPRFFVYMQYILVAVFFGMRISMSLIVSMSFIMTVSVLFMDFFIPLEHGNDMCHGSMSECCEVEMYYHESTEENP